MHSTNHTNQTMMKNRTGPVMMNQTIYEGTNLSYPSELPPSSTLLKPHATSTTLNGTTQPSEFVSPASQADPNIAVLVSLIALILILTMIFLYLVLPPLYRHVRSLIPVNPKRIEARYLTIEGWLISKRVRAHDATCPCSYASGQKKSSLLDPEKKKSPKPVLKQSLSYDTADTTLNNEEEDYHSPSSSSVLEDEADENNLECPICMSEILEDEIVSWSFSSCEHYYHHECIKEWLLRHANCPFCRQVYMPVDDLSTNKKMTKSRHSELAQERSLHASRTFVCKKGGLVTLPLPCTTSDSLNVTIIDNKGEELENRKRLCCMSVKRSELAKMRGNTLRLEVIREVDQDHNDAVDPETPADLAVPVRNSSQVIDGVDLHVESSESTTTSTGSEGTESVRSIAVAIQFATTDAEQAGSSSNSNNSSPTALKAGAEVQIEC